MTDITDQVCQWVREGLAWNSECGNGVGAEFYDGSPDEWTYCPYCGKQLSEAEGEEDE